MKYGFCPKCGKAFLVGDVLVQRVTRRWTGIFFGIQYAVEDIHLECGKKEGDQ